VRGLAVCLVCCGVGLGAWPVVAEAGVSSGEGASPVEGGGAPVSLLGGGLVVPGSPTEAEQLRAQAEAKRNAPEAVGGREASRTTYEGLSPAQAQQVDGEAFGGVIDDPAGGPPRLPAGESITGFPTDNAAKVLPNDTPPPSLLGIPTDTRGAFGSNPPPASTNPRSTAVR
jgi:hypothetical protein